MDIRPSLSEFTRLAKKGAVVPVWGELRADLETPVSVFLKLDDGRNSFLLESVEGEEKVARFSFVGSRPRLVFQSRGREIRISRRSATGAMRVERYQTASDPLAEIERLMRRYRAVPMPQLPRFYGGLVGYLGYEMVRFFERVPAPQRDALRLPEAMFMLTDSVVIIDHAQHSMRLVVNAVVEGRRRSGIGPAAVYRRSVAHIQAMAARLTRPMPRPARRPARRRSREAAVSSNLSQAEFVRMVRRAKRDIRSGEIIQVVLSQRFEHPLRCTPFDAYRALRSLNPSPYMYFLRFGTLTLAGSSPEMLVRCENGVIQTRPIAGTRRRGADAREDERLAQQLLRSPKERAEHLMLVDLSRNDVGRVAQTGSVTTPELMVVEKYSHVMHLVSAVEAKLKRGRNAYDVLRAAFPAGTVSGAPKVRAMEIIAELEREARGPYAGAVGYVSFSGNLDTCITIRTILMHDRLASVQAGAGIVADSNPAREYQETISKAQGCLEALRLAESLDFRSGFGPRHHRRAEQGMSR